MAEDANKMIYVLNGPTLDVLGTCEPEIDGRVTLAHVERLSIETAARFGLTAECRQSDHAAVLVESLHEARAKGVAGIVLNTGAHSGTSAALFDALMGVKIPTIEVHIGNSHARERSRHHSFTAKAAFASISGFGIDGYRLAITGLAAKIGAKSAPKTDIMAQA
ncbi:MULTISPECIES: type II 3-dehydroquinate dehydratase [unclassified Bradyrhizobium]|uniref:type II 3-dehydroquinate dehydratase n=1 Tax=unclassified Bradyrhizobium TaxID=2631580 RepID=UPI0028EFD319|nr:MULTISPECIES: type II 3-dehydroquinate dehydratase [unclassified Bradyrhizobium]